MTGNGDDIHAPNCAGSPNVLASISDEVTLYCHAVTFHNGTHFRKQVALADFQLH